MIPYEKEWNMKKISKILLSVLLMVAFVLLPAEKVHAGTVYTSDGVEHEEGYIIIGESHSVLTANTFSTITDENGKVAGLEGVYYHYLWDDSVYTYDGLGNTFTMWGNLFFIFEGNAESDAALQKSKEYIYSDGQGNHGVAVAKIHEIMDKNPNIKHWNIISYHGAVAALEWETTAPYYVESYKNWIDYEFPEAECYFVSHSTMTKFYKQSKSAYKFNEALKEAFPTRFLDYTALYEERVKDRMIDTIHWDTGTYIDLFSDVIRKIDLLSKYAECEEKKEAFLKRNQINLDAMSAR